MSEPFTPMPGRVLIRPDDLPETTLSGLHLAPVAQPEQTGTVAAIGRVVCPKCDEDVDPIVRVGDRVVFSWTAGQEIWLNHGQERYFILRASDLLAVVEI